MKRIRSFVRRESRMTARQKRAFSDLWDKYGIELTKQKVDFVAMFSRQASVILEIGFGMGQSLLQMAEENPECDFIGIEVYRPGIGALFAELAAKDINNVRVYYADAVDVLQQGIANKSLDKVLLFFPDPWPKKPHHKRRILQPKFVNLIYNKLKDGGIFHMATDWQDYAEHMLAVMSVAKGFSNVAGASKFSKRPNYRPLTKFERRGRKLGRNVWDLIFIA